ncbi:MAG: hypothetical protein Q9199_004670, partial [Rusavskia elegans]
NIEPGSAPLEPRAEPSDFDMSLGLLPVEKWLTKIQNNDCDLVAEMYSEHRFGQVGRLGKYPLIKPQCLPNVTPDNKKGEFARQQSRSSDFRIQRPGVEYGHLPAHQAKDERTCQRKKRPLGQIKKAGTCEKCPDKSVTKKIGDRCESKCPEGQARFGLFGQCESCPKDQRPNVAGDRCEGMCPINHARTGKNGECGACGVGKKPNAVGDKCEDDKCPDGQAKTAKDDSECTPKQPPDSDCPEAIRRKEKENGAGEERSGGAEESGKRKRSRKRKEAEERTKAEEEKKEQERKNAEQAEKDKERKVGCVGKCVQLVSLALDPDVAEDFANDFFSEDVLAATRTSPIDFNPGGSGIKPIRRSYPPSLPYKPSATTTTNLSTNVNEPEEVEPQVQKRFFPALVAAILNVGRVIGGVIARVGGRPVDLAKKGVSRLRRRMCVQVAARGQHLG